MEKKKNLAGSIAVCTSSIATAAVPSASILIRLGTHLETFGDIDIVRAAKASVVNLTTVDFQLVVQKSRRESAHARTWAGILNRKFCACVNSRRNFWTTNLKSTVHQSGGKLELSPQGRKFLMRGKVERSEARRSLSEDANYLITDAL